MVHGQTVQLSQTSNDPRSNVLNPKKHNIIVPYFLTSAPLLEVKSQNSANFPLFSGVLVASQLQTIFWIELHFCVVACNFVLLMENLWLFLLCSEIAKKGKNCITAKFWTNILFCVCMCVFFRLTLSGLTHSSCRLRCRNTFYWRLKNCVNLFCVFDKFSLILFRAFVRMPLISKKDIIYYAFKMRKEKIWWRNKSNTWH